MAQEGTQQPQERAGGTRRVLRHRTLDGGPLTGSPGAVDHWSYRTDERNRPTAKPGPRKVHAVQVTPAIERYAPGPDGQRQRLLLIKPSPAVDDAAPRESRD